MHRMMDRSDQQKNRQKKDRQSSNIWKIGTVVGVNKEGKAKKCKIQGSGI